MRVATRRMAQDTDVALNQWMNDEVDRRVWFPGDEQLAAGVYFADEAPAGATPLRDTIQDNINWVKDLRNRLNSAGIRGAEQDDALSEIFTRATYSPGYLWTSYGGPGRLPFERYYQRITKQKVISRMRDIKTRREIMPSVSITPTKKDDAPGISEQSLSGVEEEPLEEREETAKLFGQFQNHLSQQRNADKLTQVFGMMTQGLSQKEIAEQTGMSSGQVNHWKRTISDHLGNFAQGLGGTLQQSLSRLLTEMSKPSDVPKQKAQRIWLSDAGEVPVTIKKSGRKNTRIILPDGSEELVPNNQLK